MPLPVIANTYRIALIWNRHSGVAPVNVFHVRDTAPTHTDTQVGNAVWAALDNEMFTGINTAHEVHDMLVTNLTAANAATSVPNLAGNHGQSTGDSIPNLCALMSLHTAQRGSRGRGRCYVGPITETAQADGIFDATKAATMLTGWNNFIAALVANTPHLELVVASYRHADAHSITSIRVDSVCATQRRRQDQLR